MFPKSMNHLIKHEQIMFLQANGKPFNQLGRAEQVQVGKLLESSLQMFFKYGF